MKDYISVLSGEEIQYVCNVLDGRNFKQHFQKNPKEFAKIKPGFRPNALTDSDAIKIGFKNYKEPFIYEYINNRIDTWIDEIKEYKGTLSADNMSDEEALIKTLSECVFHENIRFYFKVTESSYQDEYIATLQNAVNVICSSQKTSESLQSDSLKETDSPKRPEDTNKELEEQLSALMEKYEQLNTNLSDTENEKYQLECALAKMSAELDDFKARARKSITCDMYQRNDEYPYCSLCSVYSDYEGHTRLERLCDIIDGSITGFYDENYPDYNRLYCKNGPSDDGFIGIWDWNAVPNANDPSKLYILSSYNDILVPIEVVRLDACSSESELVEKISDGIPYTGTAKRVLIAFWNPNALKYQGVLLDYQSIYLADDKIQLKESVSAVPLYVIYPSEIIDIKGKSYYNSLNIGMPDKLISVKDELEFVKGIILQRATWPAFKQKGLQHSDQRLVRDFLSELPIKEIQNEISEICECDLSHAKELLDQFIARSNEYLDADAIEFKSLEKIVFNNPDLMDACKSSIEEDWELEHKEKIEDAQKELAVLEQRFSQEKTEVEEFRKNSASIKAEHQQMALDLKRREQLAADVESKVSERIAAARQSVADFIAQQAFIQYPDQSSSSPAYPDWEEGVQLNQDDIDVNKTWKETLETLRFELMEAGIAEKCVDAVSAFLYSAYVNHCPLLLAGPNAQDIANAFSAALYGQSASILIRSQTLPQTDMIGPDHPAIILQNPFGDNTVQYLEILSEHFVIAVTPYAEDLKIEPKGILDYFTIVLTDLFVDRRASHHFVGGISDSNYRQYSLLKPQPLYNQLFAKIKTDALTKNTLQQILTDMHGMQDDIPADMDCLLGLLPCAYILDTMADFQDGISDIGLSADTLQLLNRYWSEAQ